MSYQSTEDSSQFHAIAGWRAQAAGAAAQTLAAGGSSAHAEGDVRVARLVRLDPNFSPPDAEHLLVKVLQSAAAGTLLDEEIRNYLEPVVMYVVVLCVSVRLCVCVPVCLVHSQASLYSQAAWYVPR